MFSCKFYENFKNTFFIEHLQKSTSVLSCFCVQVLAIKAIPNITKTELNTGSFSKVWTYFLLLSSWNLIFNKIKSFVYLLM